MADQRTKAELEVTYPGGPTVIIDEIIEFSYSSDVLAVGDECSFVIVGDRTGERIKALRMGATVQLFLRNPAVNGGNRTLKHLGLITDRKTSLKQGTIRVTSADLGWLLVNCSAPLWRSLRKATFGDLVDPSSLHTFIDKSFGFAGLRIDDANLKNRSLKLGKAQAVAQQQRVLDPAYAIQIEAGDSQYDVMSKYAQRFNRLIGVSVDGYIQVWNPDYNRPPAYQLRVDTSNTAVIECEQIDTIMTRYTDVVCVGEIVGYQGGQDVNDPNAGHRRGAFYNRNILPFHRLFTFGDGEMWNRDMAKKQAEWRYKRGMYDAHYLAISVVDHYQALPGPLQGASWYESDQMIRVTIPSLGLVDALYYVGSAVCESTVREGDITHLNLRLPYFLSASFGTWRTPPALTAETTAAYHPTT
jgi:hypothetical protein